MTTNLPSKNSFSCDKSSHEHCFTHIILGIEFSVTMIYSVGISYDYGIFWVVVGMPR